jgi:hypothetical protein
MAGRRMLRTLSATARPVACVSQVERQATGKDDHPIVSRRPEDFALLGVAEAGSSSG